jgi:transcriptional regulator with XRE-family HTH domain
MTGTMGGSASEPTATAAAEADQPAAAGTVSVTRLLVTQLKRIRRRRDLTAPDLAARCAQLGAAEVTENVIRNIETGRRTVSVDQLAALALALDVAPVHLLSAPDTTTDAPPVQVTATITVPAQAWGPWSQGTAPLPETDERAFWSYALEHSGPDQGRSLIEMARSRTVTALASVAGQLRDDADQQLHALAATGQQGLDEIEKALHDGDITAALTAVRLTRAILTKAGT